MQQVGKVTARSQTDFTLNWVASWLVVLLSLAFILIEQ